MQMLLEFVQLLFGGVNLPGVLFQGGCSAINDGTSVGMLFAQFRDAVGGLENIWKIFKKLVTKYLVNAGSLVSNGAAESANVVVVCVDSGLVFGCNLIKFINS